MDYKHGIKHDGRHSGKMDRKWKIVISVLAVIAAASAVFLAYLYFPIVSGAIDKGIKYLFTTPDSQEEQAAAEEETPEGPEEESTEELQENAETEEPEEEDEKAVDGEVTDEELIEEETGEEQTEQQEEGTTPQGTVPTINLRIYEGPLYSREDDICYYRITADVTGNPAPSITFNKDDSLGSLGKGKAQVNITRKSQAFTLSVTAQNSMGSASDSITLSWNCNRAPDIAGIIFETDTLYVDDHYDVRVEVVDLDGDAMTYLWSTNGGKFDDADLNPNEWDTPDKPGDYIVTVKVTDGAGNISEASAKLHVSEKPEEPENLDIPRKENEGGYIEYGGSTNIGGNIYAGDSNDNQPCSGFVSFDISGISGKTVDSATLTLSGASISGDPLGFFDDLWIHSLNWGAEPIEQSDFLLGGVVIASYDSPSIICNVSKLKQELQKAIDEGRSRFQIRIQFGGAYTDNDNTDDGWGYSQSNVDLNVTVSE